jgi:uracil-DNA glycosylase family 4
MSAELFNAIWRDQLTPDVEAALDREFPFYPLTSPGMPLPGPNFIANAARWGEPPPTIVGTKDTRRIQECGKWLHYYYRRALYDADFRIHVNVRGNWVEAALVQGHDLGGTAAEFSGGPRPAKIMIIGKHPGMEELQYQTNFVGPTSQEFFDALDELGVTEGERASWYCTNLCKWTQLDPQSDSLSSAWKQDNAILLEQELRLVKPDYILCLGSDASKHVLGGSQYGVQSMVGRVVPKKIMISDNPADPTYHTAKVMSVTHPAQVYRHPEMFDDFKAQIALFISLTNGADVGGREYFVKHKNVYKLRELKAIVDEIRSDPDPLRRIIAVDGEWEGDHPSDEGAYLRTVQFSSQHGEGITVVLRHQGGMPAFKPDIPSAMKELSRLLKYDPEGGWMPRVGGHFFRADLPWLLHEGLDLRTEYRPPLELEKCRDEGGWDTSVMYHSVNEAASYGLEDMTAKLTTVPRYDEPLMKWRQQHCKRLGIKEKDLDGYGACPPWILHPEAYEENPNYASYDPDTTRRIAIRCMEPGGLLDRDWFGNPSWEPYWIAHRASVGFLEMEMNGITLDKDRVDQLTRSFMEGHDKLLNYFRQQINWPDFNPRSHPQCRVFLFGEQYSGKIDKQTGRPIPIMPAGALSLGLPPETSTGKRPKAWATLVARGEAHFHTPSTNKEVLGILGHQHKLAMILRDIKFLAQVLSTTLRRPEVASDGQVDRDDDDNYVYSDGVPSMVHPDGKIHTHLSQLKETRRASSYRPNLQALSSRREADYARILGQIRDDKRYGDYLFGGNHPVFEQPLYTQSVRSIFRADDDHALVEVDYTGAELAMLAWLSGDPQMIEDVRRNNLPEDHPDHFDIHSNHAVTAFRLNCEPTKKALSKAGLSHMRVAAKNQIFGTPYGREAPAIARQCREEGVNITDDDAQKLIDGYFARYQLVGPFLDECESRSQEEKWICGWCGGRRRFISSRDRSVVGEQQRQARNWPIQNGVADAVNIAIFNFDLYRWEHPGFVFYRLMQIHDSLLFMVPRENVRRFVLGENGGRSVIHECMIDRVPVWPRRLDGTPMRVAEPYRFGVDFKVALNWGQKMTKEEKERFGIAA